MKNYVHVPCSKNKINNTIDYRAPGNKLVGLYPDYLYNKLNFSALTVKAHLHTK